MRGFLIRLVITAAGLWLATRLLDGIRVDGAFTLIIAALLLGIVNAIVRPLAIILTLPLTLLTLGLFLFVINAAMLGLVAAILPGLTISGFGYAFGGWLIVTVTSWLASAFIGPRGRYQIFIQRRSG